MKLNDITLLDKAIIKEFETLNIEQKEYLFGMVEQMYQSFGQLLVCSYLDSPEYIAQNWAMADDENPGIVEAKILDDPYRIHIFVNQIPEHIKAYKRAKFSKEIGFSRERQRWFLLMKTAFRELKRQGLKPFGEEKAVAMYEFHFLKTADSDNYTIRLINNCIRDAGIIKDDNINYLATYCDGVVNPSKPGVEITLLKEADFGNYYQKRDCFLDKNNPKSINDTLTD
ncbi:hypothetical protein ASZ90_017569 [hydrocarbon metagenome]|uniref:Uncharacterized protein n=1 Tax=hydrocarbon metagenome TaxID=938273 RepID=A0A0W8E8X3_9ZZZZ